MGTTGVADGVGVKAGTVGSLVTVTEAVTAGNMVGAAAVGARVGNDSACPHATVNNNGSSSQQTLDLKTIPPDYTATSSSLVVTIVPVNPDSRAFVRRLPGSVNASTLFSLKRVLFARQKSGHIVLPS